MQAPGCCGSSRQPTIPWEDQLIIITKDAAEQLRGISVDGSPAKLEFTAEPDGEGGYNCGVALVGSPSEEAELEADRRRDGLVPRDGQQCLRGGRGRPQRGG